MTRVPVVGSLAYAERVSTVSGTFSATLSAEPDNRYFRHAIAVSIDGGKVGYVAPEIAPAVYDGVAAAGAPVGCAGRRALPSDVQTSGVLLLLDLSSLPQAIAS
jgi:hypothetical protein